MQLGIFTKTYYSRNIDETFSRIRADGLRCANLNLANAGLPIMPEETDAAAIRQITESAKASGIVLSSITGTFNMIDPDERERARATAQFRTQCRIAAELGIPVVSLCTGSKNPESKWKWHNDNLLPESYRELLHTAEKLVGYAEEYNVTLGVEPETGNIINCAAAAARFIEDMKSDRFKIIIDGANLFTAENAREMKKVLSEAIELLDEDIVLAHAKDFSLANDVSFVAAGEGELDYPLYISLLKSSGYRGALLMHGLGAEQVGRSRDFLLSLI